MQKLILILFLSAEVLMLSGCSASNNTAPTDSPVTEAASTDESLHQIFLDGTCLTDTGREAHTNDTTPDGTILSVTTDARPPVSDKQANFNCLGTSYIKLADGAAALLLDGEYRLFLADDLVEYEGIYKQKKSVSEDTLKWLDFYYKMPESSRDALNMIPSEFSEAADKSGIAAMETTSSVSSYLDALTEAEQLDTEKLAQTYFTDDEPVFEGVDQIYPVDNDDSLYHNAGLESEYAPGNIIIYKVLTMKDRRDGNPFRFISIARRTKSDNWKIINCGF